MSRRRFLAFAKEAGRSEPFGQFGQAKQFGKSLWSQNHEEGRDVLKFRKDQ